MESLEVLKPEEISQSLLTAIEQAKRRLLRKIARKRKKLVKFVENLGEDFEVLIQRWAKVFLAAGTVTTIFLTSALPITAASIPHVRVENPQTLQGRQVLRQNLISYLEKFGQKRKVNPSILASLVSQITGLAVKSSLDGQRLPTISGEIATEKHLQIYPNQSLSNHLPNPESFAKFSWTGISHSPSAWGYFADNKNLTTNDLVEKEKYYLAIQTFAVESWANQWPILKEWYKFRKLLVYNPENGKAVVGVVADAGPATYTRRAFGGSPELMDELGLSSTTLGNVLVFFLDDPDNSVPLGRVL